MKRSDESSKFKLSLHQAVPHDLDITIIRKSFDEFVYEVGTEGNMANLFEHKIVKNTRDKKLDKFAYNYKQSRKRKLMGIDTDVVQQN